MTIEINQKELEDKLIYIYKYYLSENSIFHKIGIKKIGMNYDNVSLLKKAIEDDVFGLQYRYLEPNLEKKKAKQILENAKIT